MRRLSEHVSPILSFTKVVIFGIRGWVHAQVDCKVSSMFSFYTKSVFRELDVRCAGQLNMYFLFLGTYTR